MMGPIVRAADFIPQIRSKLSPTHFDLAFGLFYILTGCFKKIVISDFLRTNIVDFVFDDPSRYNGVYCLTATYAYALVIYCDFSGYSDMARGMAKWMGYDINVNFLAPYQSANITEFWRKWHISLSSWLRDYLYIPLGGNRKGKIQTYINLMITMLLGGLWHGASWNFIIWGGLHGAALSIHKLYGQIPARLRFKRIEPVTKVFNIILTFHFVCLCWIFFACHSFQDSFTVIHQIVNNFQLESIYIFVSHYRYVLLGLCTGFFLHALPMHLNTFLINKIIQVPVWGKLAITITFLLLMAYLKMERPVMPIYLQF
jgi:D-alanyl-lipoteichoic acid acyltransferase DltB (MBOAT superfamily)